MNIIVNLMKRLKMAWDQIFDLNVLVWVLPLFLAVIAITFELIEHLQKDELLDLGFIGEMLIFGLIGPLIIRSLIVWMQELLATQKQSAAEIQALNRDLEKKVVERTAALEQRNSELDRLNRELRDLDEMKSDFVALVSHELRTPLTTLNGGLELALQSSDSLPERSRAILEVMVEEVTRLTNLVQTILNVSRLEAGRLAITLGPVAVLPLLEQSAAVVLAEGKRKLSWEITPNLPPILGDEIYLEQIILNLISNADKYSPKEEPIKICACVQDGRIRISVKDYGPGIAANVSDRVFQRFSRLQNQENAPSGWGLGLYLGRKLIEAQKGEIGYISPIWETTKTPGSEFYILMPIAQDPEEGLT